MAKDVTEEILHNHLIYGCSDNTNQGRTAAGKSLNYANGASIQKAPEYELNAIPFTHKFEDTVGLFGAENYYIDFHADILDIVLKPFSEPGWEASNILKEPTSGEGDWEQFDLTDVTYNTDYEEAVTGYHTLPELNNKVISVRLNNKGTNNIYVDDWVDVNLHTADRQVHPYDFMWISVHDHFYMSVHARNTKRLPYNIELVVGESIADRFDLDPDQERFLNSNLRI